MIEHPIAATIAAAITVATISGAAVVYAKANQIAEIYEELPSIESVSDLQNYIASLPPM